MNTRIPKPTPRGRPRGPVLPDVLTRCLLLRSGRLNHPPGLGSTVWGAQTPFFPANKPFSTVRPSLRTPQVVVSQMSREATPLHRTVAFPTTTRRVPRGGHARDGQSLAPAASQIVSSTLTCLKHRARVRLSRESRPSHQPPILMTERRRQPVAADCYKCQVV